jgi:uncharacterized protein YcbK (DUF882 family)
VLKRLERAGLSPRGERLFNVMSAVLVALFVTGWAIAVLEAFRAGHNPRFAARVTENPLSPSAAPPAAFLLDAALRAFVDLPDLRGESGDVRIVLREPGADSLALPDSLPPDVELEYSPAGARGPDSAAPAPTGPGVWNLLVRVRDAIRPVPDLHLVTLVPLSEKRAGRIGGYLLGEWPYEEGGTPRSPEYAPPTGVIRVTPENQDVRVSTHLRLRDFLTKGQQDVWPKYVLVSTRLLDKVELTLDELEAKGHTVENVGVISGFRTPTYNESGGNPAGRGALSRHMYGDAIDLFIDNDNDGRMDDLNGDGRVDRKDGGIIGDAAEEVERKYPHLVGGISVYTPTGAHAGFVHIDTRGYRARW